MSNNLYSSKLRKIAELLDDGDYLTIEQEYLFDSPAGDGYGLDSTCIDFNDGEGEPFDIGDVIRELKKEDKERAIKQHLDEIERIKRS